MNWYILIVSDANGTKGYNLGKRENTASAVEEATRVLSQWHASGTEAWKYEGLGYFMHYPTARVARLAIQVRD